ncbi:RNA polymerase sigma-70 factor [Niabella aurantiaca]|uniref:RNA polymerase sigma-70 factor n=1 Tax=Niabella aurantiaca TaxID=379900 RepID=UPI00146F55F6|nr:RNA polymerase sigma-70 factor [Niabella aurantiaca]
MNKRLSSFEVFFKEHYRPLVYFAGKMIKDVDAAEDLVQDVFIRFLGRQSDFDKEISARSFLYIAVRNASLNYLRQAQNHKRILAANAIKEAEESFALQTIIKSEALNEVYKAINELPEGCRKIFRLGYLDGLSNQEIAAHLSVSINTVKTQKARALQLLRLKIRPGFFSLLTLFA